MPDDGLFDETTTTTTDSTSEEKAGEATPESLTSEGLDERMSALESRLGVSLGQMNATLQQLGTAVTDQGEAPTTPTLTDRQTALLENPDAFTEEKARQIIREEIVPLQQIQVRDALTTRVEDERSDFEETYGEGSWAEVIQEPLTDIIGKMPLNLQASDSHFKAIIAGLKGQAIDTLLEKRTEVSKTVAENKRTERARMFTGTGLPAPRGSDLSEEETDYLASLEKKGISYTKDQYLADREAEDKGWIDEDTFPTELKAK